MLRKIRTRYNNNFSYNNNIKNKNKENLQPEFIERVLKALIKYYLLNKRIREATKLNNKEEILYQKNKKYYFINSKWMKELKYHYCFENLIISIKNKNIIITQLIIISLIMMIILSILFIKKYSKIYRTNIIILKNI